jgi:hypothetical protein
VSNDPSIFPKSPIVGFVRGNQGSDWVRSGKRAPLIPSRIIASDPKISPDCPSLASFGETGASWLRAALCPSCQSLRSARGKLPRLAPVLAIRPRGTGYRPLPARPRMPAPFGSIQIAKEPLGSEIPHSSSPRIAETSCDSRDDRQDFWPHTGAEESRSGRDRLAGFLISSGIGDTQLGQEVALSKASETSSWVAGVSSSRPHTVQL